MLSLLLVVLSQNPVVDVAPEAVATVTSASERAARLTPDDTVLPSAGLLIGRAVLSPFATSAAALVAGFVGALASLIISPGSLWIFVGVTAVMGAIAGLVGASVLASPSPRADFDHALPISVAMAIAGLGFIVPALLGVLSFGVAVPLIVVLTMATPLVVAKSRQWAAKAEFGVEVLEF
jgi:hypothetical protein